MTRIDEVDERYITEPGSYRPLYEADYSAYRAGYGYFDVDSLKAAFDNGPVKFEDLFQKQIAKTNKNNRKNLPNEDDFRNRAPSLYVAFGETEVTQEIDQQLKKELEQIYQLRQQMSAMIYDSAPWKTKDRETKQLMDKYGVAAFGDPTKDPEFLHCFERVDELMANIATKDKPKLVLAPRRKTFRILNQPAGTSSRGIKVQVAGVSDNRPAEKATTQNHAAVAAKLLPVPHP